MQISKLSVAICAAFVGVLPLTVHAADTEAQTKAREALEKAMSQPAPQTTITTNPVATPKAAKPQKSAPAPAPAPVAVQPAAEPVSVPPAAATTSTPPVRMLNAPPSLSPDAAEKARAALRQKMAEQQNQVVVTPPPTKPVPPTKPGTTGNPPPPHVVYVPPSDHHDNHMTPPPGQQPPLAPTKVVAPPLPISATKEAQLQELLIRYKADQISPQDYHKERARILAGP